MGVPVVQGGEVELELGGRRLRYAVMSLIHVNGVLLYFVESCCGRLNSERSPDSSDDLL